ncbi:hypothetical protein V5799_006992 [Amblyomma americanum]|uniref:Major facilitator superfamily associated domain-containing protein n=1 Tax=Amblyomma americanum TaxID=6943 RepID=A0AAQ4DUT2_AMBAM
MTIKENMITLLKYTRPNLHLLPLKMHMFLYFGAVVGVMPFTTVLAKQLGISAALAGLVNTTLLFLSILMRFAFGSLTDKVQQLKVVLIAIISVESFFHFLLIYVPPIKPTYLDIAVPSPENVFQNDTQLLCFSQAHFEDCQPHSDEPCRMSCEYAADNSSSSSAQDIAFPFNCSVMCYQQQWCLPMDEVVGVNASFLDAAVRACTVRCPAAHQPNTMRTATFWLFAVFRVLGGTAFGVGISLADAAAYAMLRDRKEDYGKQRLWGTIGWGALAPLIGYLNELATGDSPYIDYSPGFYMLAAFTLMDVFSLCFLDVPRSSSSKQLLKDLSEVLVNPRALFFTFSVLNIGFLMGFVWSYGLWYLQDLGATPTLLGANLAVQCFGGEVPVLFFSGWIIKRIGYGNAVSLSIAGLCLRLAVYSFGTDVWAMLPVEVTHGLCFGLFYAAMTSYASTAAPPGTEATMQGILGGTFEGLGIASGTLVAGQLYSEVGGRQTCYIYFIYSVVFLVFHIGVQLFFTVSDSRRESVLSGSQPSQRDEDQDQASGLALEVAEPDSSRSGKEEEEGEEVV